LMMNFLSKLLDNLRISRRYWDLMFGLNYVRTIWIAQEDLGKDVIIRHRKKRYEVKIPPEMNTKVTLILKGLGKTKDNQTGDLLLDVWLNKGEDVRKDLWISETSARIGIDKILLLGEKKIQMSIPPNSREGLVICLKGLGRMPVFKWRAPFLHRKRGNLLVRLFVYPETISPKYGSFETLTTDDMAMEGFVYRMKDELTHKLGESAFRVNPIKADLVADQFNNYGWEGIFYAFVRHLKLTNLNIAVKKSDSIPLPGSCQKFTITQNNNSVGSNYEITIKDQFLDNPFTVAAILAHELCHVIYSERIDSSPRGYTLNMKGNESDSLKAERTVDLLVFMFKLGEFQLRVSRDQRLTFGYFKQDIFERIQVIASKK
jgi:hypothetical protein